MEWQGRMERGGGRGGERVRMLGALAGVPQPQLVQPLPKRWRVARLAIQYYSINCRLWVPTCR